jgi:hypothetical protein
MWQGGRVEDLNVMLAELLSEYCLKAVGEVIIRRKMSDVLMDLNGVRIIIEGKNVGNREELYTHACRRIGSGLCDAVVMVEYVKLAPEKQTQLRVGQKMIKQALKNGTFHVGFVTYGDRGGLGRWIPQMRKKPEFYENVDFQKLVAHLMRTYDALVKETNRDKVIGYLGLLNTSKLPI